MTNRYSFNSSRRVAGGLVFIAIVLMLLLSCRSFFDFGELFLRLNGKSLIERGSIGANEWQSFLARSARREQQQTFGRVHHELKQATSNGTVAAQVIFYERGMIIVNPRGAPPSQKLAPITVVRSERDLPTELSAKSAAVSVHSESEFASDTENNWTFAARQEAQLSADAKMFLNEPSFSLYLVCTFFFYPRRIDVDLNSAQIQNDETFDAAFNASSLDRVNLPELASKLRGLGYSHLIMREDGVLKTVELRNVKSRTLR